MYYKFLFVTGQKTIERLNMALESADREKFYEILQIPCLEISRYIDEFAIPLYYQEMKEDHIESGVRLHIYVYFINFLEIKALISFRVFFKLILTIFFLIDQYHL